MVGVFYNFNNNMRKLFKVLFFLLLSSACSNEQQQPKDFIEIDLVPIIEGEAKKVSLQEWGKNVCFIPLDAHAGISFKLINNVFKRDDILLVNSLNRLSVFDRDGKYLYDIGSKGRGPEEFTTNRAVVLHNDLIYVHEFSGIVKVYDWKGNFVKKLNLPSDAWEVLTVSGEEEMLAYVANHNGEEAVRFYRMKGEEVLDTIFNPFRYKKPANWLYDYEDEIRRSTGSLEAFMEMNSDTLYRLDKHLQIHPYIVFNMGKYLFTREERYTSDNFWKVRENKINLKVTGAINEKVYFFNDCEPSMIREVPHVGDTYCYDKITKETSKYFLTYGENDWGILPDASFIPRTMLEDKYLVDWESSGNEENAVLVLVEP